MVRTAGLLSLLGRLLRFTTPGRPRCSGSLLRGSLAITTAGLPPASHQNLSRRTMLLLAGVLNAVIDSHPVSPFVAPCPGD